MLFFSARAKKSLKKLDRHIAKQITIWIHENLVECEDPRAHGKALSANRAGQWRYRVGDYLILAEIQDDAVLILLLEIGHRREIFIEKN